MIGSFAEEALQEFAERTTCVRKDGTRYGIAPGKKCRKGSEGTPATTEEKDNGRIKRRVQKQIAESTRVKMLRKALEGRRNAVAKREAFINSNQYPAANAGMQKEIEKIKGEIKDLQQQVQSEHRQIAQRVVRAAQKATKAQREGRLNATRARAEKVLVDLRKERESGADSDTARSARAGVFNKSQWD